MSEQLPLIGQVLTTEVDANALPAGSVVLDNMGDAQRREES